MQTAQNSQAAQEDKANWGIWLDYLKTLDKEAYYTLIVIDDAFRGDEKDYSRDQSLIAQSLQSGYCAGLVSASGDVGIQVSVRSVHRHRTVPRQSVRRTGSAGGETGQPAGKCEERLAGVEAGVLIDRCRVGAGCPVPFIGSDNPSLRNIELRYCDRAISATMS